MHLHENDASRLFSAAKYAARHLCRKQTEPWLDAEDVGQDLAVDLLARLKSYDPTRGSLMTYASLCFRHRASRLRKRARQHMQRRTISLSAPLSNTSTITVADTLADTGDYKQKTGASNGLLARADDLFDLDRALSSLSKDALLLCALLVANERDPVGASGLPRTTFYRRLAELRCHLLAAGIPAPRGSRVGAQ